MKHVSQHVLRPRIFILQDYGAKLIYLEGGKNAGANALSRLPTDKNSLEVTMTALFNIERNDPGTNDFFHLDNRLLADAQQYDETLLKLKRDTNKPKFISANSIFGTKVMTYKYLIWVPPEKRNHIIE